MPPARMVESGEFVGHIRAVHSLCLSRDGKRLVTAGFDGRAILWDTATGERIEQFPPDLPADLNQYLDQFGGYSLVGAAAFAPDESQIVTGCLTPDRKAGIAQLWDIHSGKEVRRFLCDSQGVFSVSISPDGKRLLAGGGSGQIRLWDISSGKEVCQFDGIEGATVVAFAPDGSMLVTEGSVRTVLWDAHSLMEIRDLERPETDVGRVVFSPDGQLLAGGFADGVCRVWSVNTGKLIHSLNCRGDDVVGVAWSANGRRIATATYATASIRIWDAQTGGEEFHATDTEAKALHDIAFSRDGRYVITAGADGTARKWSIPEK